MISFQEGILWSSIAGLIPVGSPSGSLQCYGNTSLDADIKAEKGMILRNKLQAMDTLSLQTYLCPRDFLLVRSQFSPCQGHMKTPPHPPTILNDSLAFLVKDKEFNSSSVTFGSPRWGLLLLGMLLLGVEL